MNSGLELLRGSSEIDFLDKDLSAGGNTRPKQPRLSHWDIFG
jgi:hypothetical protein